MPRPYSVDLRERVLRAHEGGEGSQRGLARRFGVSVGTVSAAGSGSRARKGGARPGAWAAPAPGGRWAGATRGCYPGLLAALVAERNDATLAEYADLLAERSGRRFSLSAICRALKRQGLTRKKRRSAPPSATARTSPPGGGPLGARRWARSIPGASSSSTRAASTPA